MVSEAGSGKRGRGKGWPLPPGCAGRDRALFAKADAGHAADPDLSSRSQPFGLSSPIRVTNA